MKSIIKEFINLIFPNQDHCVYCGKAIQNGYLCNSCAYNLNLLNKKEFCRKCGKFIKNNREILLCKDCFHQIYPYTFVRAFGLYQGMLKELIHRFKFNGYRKLADLLADLMIDVMQGDLRFIDVDMIIPVPISDNKLNQRRFNQSELLAKKIAKVMKIKIDTENLLKIKDTNSQSKLTKKERLINLKNAFVVCNKGKIEGQKILLIDDIITTGSTVCECSRVLLKAGAHDVKVLTLAAGEDKKERGNENELT